MSDIVETTVGDTGTAAASQVQNTEKVSAAPETTTQSVTEKNTAGSEPTNIGGSEEAVSTPAYTPNYKFKAFQKEMELDSFWHPLIKDADSEKKVKDLFTRAEAFNDMKARFEGTQTEFEKVFNEYTALDADVRRVTSFLNRGDLDNFFNALGISEEKIYDWVSEKIRLAELPPEQQRLVAQQAQERQRLMELETQNQDLHTQYQQQATQARAIQLDMVLSRPEVSQAASAWDSRMGQLGAFRDLVIEEAQKAWYTSRQDLSVEQAVSQVLTKYGKLIEYGGAAPQMPGTQAPSTQAPAPQVQAKPVIPTVQGRGTSPIKKAPQTIDDLRKLAKEMGA